MGKPHPTSEPRSTLIVGLIVLAALLIPISSAWPAAGRSRIPVPVGADRHFGPKGEIDVNACAERPQPGTATCFARERIDQRAESLSPAREHGPKALAAKGTTSTGTTSTDVTVGDNGAYSPAYLQSAYDTPSASPGATVAIVDAYDNSRAESDLAYYRSYYGLPACTTANGCFRKVDQRGGTSYPQGDQVWGGEMSLDLDMVSAICPNCNILLVEADSNSWSDLNVAVNEAVALGASVVSMSWGGSEYAGETTANQYFDHPGVAMVASSGDSGYGAQFPAASPDVVSVGGTTLYQATDTGARDATETVWVGSGSGCSSWMAKPSWQHDTACPRRTINDVSAVADPSTGVWVWDTYPNGGGWHIFGGTSVAAPIVAALYALAGNDTNSTTEMPSTLYGDPSGFNDITSGSNGSCALAYLCTTGPGYDGPTGLGTPNGITPFLLSSAPPAPPTASISSPANGATVSGTSQVQVSASGGTGVASATLSVDGSTVGTDTAPPWTFSVDTTKLANGSHTLAVTVTDTSGNSASAQVSVNVQNAPPDTKAPSTPSGLKLAVAGTTQAAIFWSPSTDNVGVAGYNVYRDGVLVAHTTLPNYLDTGLSSGTSHTYAVTALDAVGNVSAASSKLSAKTVALSTSSTSTIAGVVYSSAGKPLSNVVVTLTGNGLTKSAKTNGSGVYKFSSLPAGTYTLAIATGTTTSSASQGMSVAAVPGETLVLVASS